MAASTSVCLFIWNFLGLILLFILSAAMENSTDVTPNVTLFTELNVTHNETDSYSESTTSSYSSTDPPSLHSGPLPVSGHLLTPVADVGSLCPCDEHKDTCDINCCCDRECGEEVAVFTGCLVESVRGNKQQCRQEVASYSLGSTVDGYSILQSSVQRETNSDIFCIQSQNGVDGLSHPSPAVPTDSNFDSLFRKFTSFIFNSEETGGQVSTADVQTSSGYQYGDVMETVGENEERGLFWLPAPILSADCMDTSLAAFLKDQSSLCSRHVVLEQDCSTLQALNMDTYANIQLFAGKNSTSVVPVQVASVILQSVEGTQTELQLSEGETLHPILLNPTLCANVVLKVGFMIKYNPDGEILNATLSVVLGFVHDKALPLQQEFHITFVQEDVNIHHSGNPGYVVGLPLVSGRRTADGITRSIHPSDSLSVLHSDQDQNCLRGRHQRSPVLFGVDFVSGCTIRLEEDADCSLVFQTVLEVLRGPNRPEYVASFGNSPLEYPLDWVPITSSFSPRETQSCSIPVSLHLEVKWTKYGSLLNPQAQINSVKEVIQTNTSSLDLLSGGSNILSIRSSVAFVDVSDAASPRYRAMPTIDAKLPADFFFPFV